MNTKRLKKRREKLKKRYGFEVLDQTSAVEFGYIFPNNEEEYHSKEPLLVNKKNVDKAVARNIKKSRLIFVDLPKGFCGSYVKRVLLFTLLGKEYTIVQCAPVMLDGASTPVRIGNIASVSNTIMRAFYVHDLLYGIFHEICKKDADLLFKLFALYDGNSKVSTGVMYNSVRFFGNSARNKYTPQEHWNYGRCTLEVK